ncbi:MAG: hypothetical protein JSU04_05705 [Bdellovibrionales bacterium]|nr:hypothetical protein [Bdellovibrionales bacterium]
MRGTQSFGLSNVFMIIGFALSMIGCAKGGSDAQSTQVIDDASVAGVVSETKTVSSRIKHTCKQNSEKCFTDTYTVASNPTGKVDVLFVLQTSDSIAEQRAFIASEIDAFVQTLPPTADFNIAVMLSHGSTSSWSGRLYRAASEPIVLKSSELSNADIQTYLSQKLTQVVADPDSGGGEEGMFSLFNGITTPALLSESQGLGFFRADAALGVVFIGDRRDICAAIPAGVPAETDPVKIDARIRDCEGLTAAGLTNRLHVLKGSQDLQVSAITYVDSPAPAGKEIGYGYIDMVALSPGVAIDIAHDDISDGLASIAELAGQGSSIQTQFELTHDNVDPSTVKVTVNGVAATFTIEGNVVTVTSPIPAGATVVIDYCLKGKAKCHGHHHNHRKCRPLHWWKNCWQYKGGKWCYKWNYSDCNQQQNNNGGKYNTKNPYKYNTGKSNYKYNIW